MIRWRRLHRWITGRSAGAPPASVEDPEALLTRASEEMRVMHAKNRERAVQAITQKNNLQAMVDETQRRVDALQAKAETALDAGDEVLASRILQEKQSYDQTLQLTRSQLEQAIQTSEQVKEAIKREDEKIRQKTAEALALKTQWRLIQVEQALTISLAQLSAYGNLPATQAQVQERHRRNRTLVVEAITQKNYLEALAAETRKKTDGVRARADLARRSGDEALERRLLREMEQHEATLASTDAALHQAIQVTDRARGLLDEESAHFQSLRIGEAVPGSGPVDADEPTQEDVARYRASLLRATALALLFAFVALIISLIFK